MSTLSNLPEDSSLASIGRLPDELLTTQSSPTFNTTALVRSCCLGCHSSLSCLNNSRDALKKSSLETLIPSGGRYPVFSLSSSLCAKTQDSVAWFGDFESSSADSLSTGVYLQIPGGGAVVAPRRSAPLELLQTLHLEPQEEQSWFWLIGSRHRNLAVAAELLAFVPNLKNLTLTTNRHDARLLAKLTLGSSKAMLRSLHSLDVYATQKN